MQSNSKLMGVPPEQHEDWMWKIWLFVFSASIGLLAKLGSLYHENKFQLKRIVKEVTCTAAAAVSVYLFCSIYKLDEKIFYLAGVFAGYLGNKVIPIIWDGFKNLINKLPML